ncbi:TPA: ferrous iron transport protein A [Candidatus Poribacteria bacterium]|nr:ferrous iron transport protein A [Candidatus Poribacteria bacterium]HEX29442.1 ferrous iron transport protein A [Candidatus Poribacteria bacterium]
MIPLSMVGQGRVRVVNVAGGRGVLHRLMEIGVRPGDVVDVLQNGPGPVIIAKGNLRIGIGFGMAHKILVVPER